MWKNKKESKKGKTLFVTFVKWLLMWACDVVPGVSGWTIAFITGIYERLITALSNINFKIFPLLAKWKIRQIRTLIDANFLFSLLVGIVLSIFTLAWVIEKILQAQPHLLYGFFVGLIAASIVLMMKKMKKRNRSQWFALLLGCLWGLIIINLTPMTLYPSWWMIILSAAIAICAMILPGISGSFLLLIMGMYPHVLQAVNEINSGFLLLFALGIVTGLLLFVHFAKRALKHYHDITVATLIGLMIGSYPKIRPRQNLVPHESLFTNLALPADYHAQAQLWMVILLAILGVAIVMW